MRLPLLLSITAALAACGEAELRDSGDRGAPAATADAAQAGDSAAEAVAGGGGNAGNAGNLGNAGKAGVEVWFSRGEAPAAVSRRVVERSPEAALSALLAGPTAAERAAGLDSWFSERTADALGGVERHEGLLIVDFRDLDRRIPGAGSSAGSAQLLAALDSTVFQFAAVDSVEYRLDGSCADFWQWLQRECRMVKRQ